MKDIKFTLYSCVYMGSGYTDWSMDYSFRNERVLDLPKLQKIVSGSSWEKFKLRIHVTQSDFSELTLFEHEVTLDYISRLSMCKKPFELLGIEIKDKESEKEG